MKNVLENVSLSRSYSVSLHYRVSSSRELTSRFVFLSPQQPEAIANLNSLVKAQLVFHSTAAEALAAVQGEIEEASVAAEGEYRASRV